MKQVSVVIILTLVLAGVVFGFVLPSVGRSNHEVLVREWVEESPVMDDSLKTSTSLKKKRADEVKKDSTGVTSSSNEYPKVALPEKHESKEVSSTEKTKVRKVTKQESLQVSPLKFSRAAHFRPVERIVSDTVVAVVDSVEENIPVTVEVME